MTEMSEQGVEQYFPTREDMDAVFGDESDWVTCEFCGEDYPVGGECDCNDGFPREREDDFPMYLEYEGAYGLSGYDEFYDHTDAYDY